MDERASVEDPIRPQTSDDLACTCHHFENPTAVPDYYQLAERPVTQGFKTRARPHPERYALTTSHFFSSGNLVGSTQENSTGDNLKRDLSKTTADQTHYLNNMQQMRTKTATAKNNVEMVKS